MASSSRIHGLHEVDQNETLAGFPYSTSYMVSKDSPLAFSTFTEGTWADARTDIKSDNMTADILIKLPLSKQSYRIFFFNSKYL